MSWDLLNRIATIVTLVWIPSVFILYIWLRRKLKALLNLGKSKYISKRLSWKCSFDYSNNNWRYQLWKDEQFFELMFSKASDVSIHVYKDPPSIIWIAIAKWIYDISKIKDASIYDMSSRSRTLQEWEIVILKNIYWNFCAVKIIDIKDRTRNDDQDNVTFEYLINIGWYSDFRK